MKPRPPPWSVHRGVLNIHTKGEKNEDRLRVPYCYCSRGCSVVTLGLRAGAAIQRTRKRLQPAQPAAIGRNLATAGAHHAAAGSDQGGREQRSAVPLRQL